MTPDQKKKLGEIGRELIDLFPSEYGNVSFRFNLNPNRKDVNMNVNTEFSEIIKEN